MSIALVQIDGREGAKFEALQISLDAMPKGFFTCAQDYRSPSSKEKYSKFILQQLPDSAFTQTDHVLIVQEDGYITNPELWDDSWLQYDYIGAPWPFPPYVGNGGFSLRSRKLLEACRGFYEEGVYEDVSICCRHREELIAQGIKFAPLEVAAKFSRELVDFGPPTFGFHSVPKGLCICGGEAWKDGHSICEDCYTRLPQEFHFPSSKEEFCAGIDWLRLNPREAVPA